MKKAPKFKTGDRVRVKRGYGTEYFEPGAIGEIGSVLLGGNYWLCFDIQANKKQGVKVLQHGMWCANEDRLELYTPLDNGDSEETLG